MNRSLTLPFSLLSFTYASLQAQVPLVGTGSNYASIFSPTDSITYDVPGGGLASLSVSDGSTAKNSGIWDLMAQGGANASILLSLTESAAQTSLTGSSLQFGVSNDNDSLLALLGGGASIHYAWSAEARFDTPGSVLTYTPHTAYHVSFDVTGTDGLLSVLNGVVPEFTFELIDGSGNALSTTTSATAVDIGGLLGFGISSGTVNLDYIVDGAAPTGPIGVRFVGDAQVGASAQDTGMTFATISDFNITATPVPEPRGAALIGAAGLLLLVRRRRFRQAA